MTITKCDVCGKEIKENAAVKVTIENKGDVYLYDLAINAEYDMCRECAEDLKQNIESMRSI